VAPPNNPEPGTGPPLFSVVIPAYNAASTITSAVRSALTQTRADLEVIVVDDGSTDETAAVVAAIEDPSVRLLAQPNRGQSAARNNGIATARGKYVVFLDSDDLLLPRYVELVARALAEADRPGFAYTDAYAFDPLTGKIRQRTVTQRMRPPIPPPRDAPGFLLELLKRNFIYVSTTVPKHVFEEVGGFDAQRTGGAEDYELWLKIVIAGYCPVWVPGQQALYRSHAGQVSRDQERTDRGLAGIYAGLRLEDMPTAAHRELLVARRRELARELAIHAGRARTGAVLRAGRHALGRVRTWAGFGERWYDVAPPEVASAFSDLTAV